MSEVKKRILITWGFWVLGPWIIVMIVYGMFRTVEGIELSLASRSWVAVNGELVSKEVRRGNRSGSRGASHKEAIQYTYVVDGNRYTSDKVYAYEPARLSVIRFDYVVQVPGDAVRVYVNPDDPRQAALRKGLSHWVWLDVALLVVFLIVAVGLWCLSWKHRQRLKRHGREVRCHDER